MLGLHIRSKTFAAHENDLAVSRGGLIFLTAVKCDIPAAGLDVASAATIVQKAAIVVDVFMLNKCALQTVLI